MNDDNNSKDIKIVPLNANNNLLQDGQNKTINSFVEASSNNSNPANQVNDLVRIVDVKYSKKTVIIMIAIIIVIIIIFLVFELPMLIEL